MLIDTHAHLSFYRFVAYHFAIHLQDVLETSDFLDSRILIQVVDALTGVGIREQHAGHLGTAAVVVDRVGRLLMLRRLVLVVIVHVGNVPRVDRTSDCGQCSGRRPFAGAAGELLLLVLVRVVVWRR